MYCCHVFAMCQCAISQRFQSLFVRIGRSKRWKMYRLAVSSATCRSYILTMHGWTFLCTWRQRALIANHQHSLLLARSVGITFARLAATIISSIVFAFKITGTRRRPTSRIPPEYRPEWHCLRSLADPSASRGARWHLRLSYEGLPPEGPQASCG